MAKIKICLDAGHYGKYNRSPAVKTYYESEMNWKLHLLLKKYLEQYGIEVILTRWDQEKDMDLQARGRCAKGCDLFLSIHSNAVGSGVNESVDYPVVYVPINGTGNALGKKLSDCIASVMETKQDGDCWSKKGSGDWDYYGVIYGAVSVGVPGLILEHSFHTNTRSTKWLMDDNNLDKMARAEADVIAAHYGLKKPEPKETFRVISGAYTVRKNADDKLAKVRKVYPDAIMISADSFFKIQIAECNTLYEAKRKQTEVESRGLDCYIGTDADVTVIVGKETSAPVETEYTLKQFVMDIQKACGAAVDGIAGAETISKTPTLSAQKNARHAAVKPVQKRLKALGYDEVGTADGIAGVKFTSAVGNFQQDNGCYVDGEITAKNKTWRKLLGME